MAAYIRTAQPGDRQALQIIWNTVFGDSREEIDAFFDIYADSVVAIVADADTGPAAAGYILPAGSLLYDGASIPCAMIYAVATLPEYRNRGYGAAVVRELISSGYANGFKAIVLCPSSDSMFEYYSGRTDMRDWFYVSEKVLNDVLADDKASLMPVTEAEYIEMREFLLAEVPHIALNEQALSHQLSLAGYSGGGLYRADTPAGAGCAVVERQSDGGVWIKELLAADYKAASCALSAITTEYPASSYTVRTPAAHSPTAGVSSRRFGMIAVSPGTVINGSTSSRTSDSGQNAVHAMPYYGLAFD